MGARTGSQFLEGLRKTKREIWVDGERFEDVTAHPKLRGGVESLAAIFDRQHAYAADCLFMHPDSGRPRLVLAHGAVKDLLAIQRAAEGQATWRCAAPAMSGCL